MAMSPQMLPQTGLIGSEQAIQAGLGGGLSALQQGYGRGRSDIISTMGVAGNALEAPVSALNALINPGTQAGQQQAALSGALGSDAQRAAYASFNDSPGQQFLREQGERAVLRNASAVGGLGGGRVLQELQRQGMGLAQQDLENQFNRLGQVTSTGLNALGQRVNIAGQQAGIASQLGGQLGTMGMQSGQSAADLIYGTGQQMASGRTRAGEQIAGNVQQTSTGIADLLRQQGTDLSTLVGQGSGNVANLMQAAAQAQASGNTELATLLANIATGSATQRVNLPSLPGTQTNPGILGGIGQAAQGLGAAYTAFSDLRLKTNIQPIGALGSGLAVYKWDWTDEAGPIVGNQPAFGVIAQEVAEIQPDAVMVGDDGYLRVNYGALL
jgi:hypothetical protein